MENTRKSYKSLVENHEGERTFGLGIGEITTEMVFQ
jgi:hypothetical protein